MAKQKTEPQPTASAKLSELPFDRCELERTRNMQCAQLMDKIAGVIETDEETSAMEQAATLVYVLAKFVVHRIVSKEYVIERLLACVEEIPPVKSTVSRHAKSAATDA